MRVSAHQAKHGRPNPVFVLGSGAPNALGVVRCFGRRGIPVLSLNWKDCLQNRVSRYGKMVISPRIVNGDLGYAQFLLDLAKSQESAPVLIPTDDVSATYTLTHRGMLEPFVRFISSPVDVARKLLDKGLFADVLRQAGVAHPATIVAECVGDAKGCASSIGYPCLLKPAHSPQFAAQFGLKCFLVHDERELEERWHQTAALGLKMLLQELIPGRRIYMWYGYYDAASRLVAYYGYHKTRQYPADFGCGSFVTAANEQDKIEMGDRVLRHIGYHGIVEPEFKYDPRDGRWKILEINARTSTQNRLSATAGLDMEYLAYREAVGRALPHPTMDVPRLLWTDTVRDLASALSDPEMNLLRWVLSRRGRKVHGCFAADDPLPAIVSIPEGLRGIAGALLRRWAPGVYALLRKAKAGSRLSSSESCEAM